MGFFRKAKCMAKEFVDEVEALIAKVAPANPDQLKADVLAAIQPHLDATDADAAATKAEVAVLKADDATTKADIVDLQKVITDALQHMVDGKPADAQAVLQAAADATAPAVVAGTTGADNAGATGGNAA